MKKEKKERKEKKIKKEKFICIIFNRIIKGYGYNVQYLLDKFLKYKILQSKTIHNKIELEFLNIFYGKSSSLPWKGAVKNI